MTLGIAGLAFVNTGWLGGVLAVLPAGNGQPREAGFVLGEVGTAGGQVSKLDRRGADLRG